MGRRPPSFFFRATRLAPASHGATDAGACPASNALITFVVDETAFCAELEHGALKASRRWVGRSPEGPGLEVFGREFAALSVN